MKTMIQVPMTGALVALVTIVALAADQPITSERGTTLRPSNAAPAVNDQPVPPFKTRLLINADTANEVDDLLYRRWVDHMDGGRARRTIWDLSVISCLIHPEFGEQIKAITPPENTPRDVQVYSRIDGRRIREEFFTALARHYELD